MSLSDTLPFPRPETPRPTEAFGSILQMQMALSGQMLKANKDAAEFMADRLSKDADFVARLAGTRMPTDAARLVMGHMQDAFADFAAQAMRFGAAFHPGADDAPEDGPAPVPMTAGMAAAAADAAAQPSVPAQARAGTSGKPPRGEPV